MYKRKVEEKGCCRVRFQVVKMSVTPFFLAAACLVNPAIASECESGAELSEHTDLSVAQL